MAQQLKAGDLIQPKHKVLRIVSQDPWTNDYLVTDAAGVPAGAISYEMVEDWFEKVEEVACVAELLESVMAKVIAAHLPPGELRLAPGRLIPITGTIEPKSHPELQPRQRAFQRRLEFRPVERIACPLCPSNFATVGGEHQGVETLDPRYLWAHLREHHGMSVKTAADLLADPARNGVGVPMVVADCTEVKPAKPPSRPRYTLGELIAQCDPNAPRPPDDQEWLDDKPVGRERI